MQVPPEQYPVFGAVFPLAPVAAEYVRGFECFRHFASAHNAPSPTSTKNCIAKSLLLRPDFNLRKSGHPLLK